jgi:S1-C subfamily serine protease
LVSEKIGMSRIKIDLKAASVEQVAAQLLTILRENGSGGTAGAYFPGCLESIQQFEFTPSALGLNVRGGVLIQSGGAVSSYGGDRGPDWLRKKYSDAVHWLRQKGYIVRDHTQRSDQFAEVTTDGQTALIDSATMLFVIPRQWTHWRAIYEKGVFHLGVRKGGDEFSGTAFLIGPNRLATCEHNFAGDVLVYIDNAEIAARDEKKHAATDVAVFSLGQSVSSPLVVLPLRDDLPSPGEEVAILGFPAVPQRQPTLNISVGAVEALPTNYRGDSQFIQVSIQTAGGYSGGPVIDQCGRVIGVVTERTFEAVKDADVPSRPFSQVVPVRYLKELL